MSNMVRIIISGETSKYERAMRDVKLSTKRTTGVIQREWIAAAGAIYGAMKIWEGAKLGARARQEQESFKNMAAGFGASADLIIAQLKKASGETVDTMTLINKAGTAMMMGISPDKVVKLMEIARGTARMTGQSVTKAFEDISLGVGRQSRMILDNLGIIVKIGEANEQYAASLGKTSAQLTDAEKKQAFMNATVTAGEDLIKKIGGETRTQSEELQAFEASIEDIKTSLSTMLTPAVAQLAGWLKTAAGYWSEMFDTDPKKLQEKRRNQILQEINTLEKRLNNPAYRKAIGKNAVSVLTQELERAEAEFKHLDKTLRNWEKYDRKPVIAGAATGSAGGGDVPDKDLKKQKELAVKTAEAVYTSYWERIQALSRSNQQNLWDYEDSQKPDVKADAIKIADDVHEEYFKRMEELSKKNKSALSIYEMHQQSIAELGKTTEKTFGDEMKNAVTGWANGFSAELTDMVWGADMSFKKIATSFGKMITQMAMQKMVVEPILGMIFPSAKGNAFAGPGISRYENKIVSKPTVFPFAKGVGLMGEGSRPEAIMPLTRTPSGDLGVKAMGGGGGSPTTNIIVTGNDIRDAESERRVITQIAAAVADARAPDAVVNAYQNDHEIRTLIRSGK